MRGEPCPNCGYHPKPPARAVDVIDADLVELGVAQRTAFDRRRFFLELRGHQHTARKKDGSPYHPKWAQCQYKDKFKTWPPWHWNDEPPLEPSLETRRWIRSKQIAWLRAKAG
jgi:hypothetical protein